MDWHALLGHVHWHLYLWALIGILFAFAEFYAVIRGAPIRHLHLPRQARHTSLASSRHIRLAMLPFLNTVVRRAIHE
jgi:hypothetical protein